jgi:hypothetical protein
MIAAVYDDACLHVRLVMIAMDVFFMFTKPHALEHPVECSAAAAILKFSSP